MAPGRVLLSAVLLALLLGCGKPVDKRDNQPMLVATGLPLFLGEGGVGAILQEADQRAGIVRKLSEEHTLIPVDILDRAALARGGQLLLIQPRALSGEELVALDEWVRAGGRALIFADPSLVWPSELAIGDARRAPAITLLDPLLSHWGLILDFGEESPEMSASATIGGFQVQVAGGGRWRTTGHPCTVEERGLVADCTLGRGRALLVADADLLDDRRWTALGDETVDAIRFLIERANRPVKGEHSKNKH